MPAYWIEEPVEIKIKGDIVRWTIRSDSDEWKLRATPAMLLESIRRSSEVYNEWARKRGTNVIKLEPGEH
jgi:hypothetical protein